MSAFLVRRTVVGAGNLSRLRCRASRLSGLGNLGSRRTLLSSAYSCEDAWNGQREACETLKHITPERYFFELNQKYQQKAAVSAVDVDIYINSVFKLENQDELEHIVRRFRKTKRTVDTLPSTHHGVCRFYLRNGKRDALLKLLQERVQYGIFPDPYIVNILMDSAIKEENLEEAFEVVKLLMLQEDSGNEITKTLALHTLVGLMDTVTPKEAPEAKEGEEAAAEEEDDDEIEYIRVPYITNAYFDDHFDLTNRTHLFGKSLYFFGMEIGRRDAPSEGDRVLSATAQVLGLILYEKWEKLNKVLEKFGSSVVITGEPKKVLEKTVELTEDPALKDQLTALITRLQPLSTHNSSITNLVANRLTALPNLEILDISSQKALFADFEANRQAVLKKQLDDLLHAQARAQIADQKAELETKKRLYHFFENFPKHEIDFVEAEKRIKELQEKTVVDEDYIPPERY